MPKSPNADDLTIIGQFGKTHGIHGWLFVRSFTVPPSNLFNYQPWYIEQSSKYQQIKVIQHKNQQQKFIVQLDQANTIEQVTPFINKYIFIEKTLLPNLPENEIYWSELEGFSVINRENVLLGKIDHLIEIANQTIIIVQGEKRYLIPYIKNQYVIIVDKLNKQMVVDWDKDF
ncbi:MAG: ribosome maturation factor RimM [Pseudomonadota bacterium]